MMMTLSKWNNMTMIPIQQLEQILHSIGEYLQVKLKK